MLMMALLGFVFLSAVGCHKHSVIDDVEEPHLYISLRVPQPTVTKADVGNVSASQAERALSSIAVWVFRHSQSEATATAFAYLEISSAQIEQYNLNGGSVARFSISLTSEDAAEQAIFDDIVQNKPNVDVYAIANPASVSLTPSKNVTRGTLDNLAMSGDLFGISTLQETVPDEGLPYSGVIKDVAISGSFPVLSVSTVTLKRAVSKFRLLLCRMDEGIEDGFFNITGIQLNSAAQEMFSASEYVFNDSDNDFKVSGYLSSTVGLGTPSSSQIIVNNNPSEFIFRHGTNATETADDYDSRLTSAVADNKLTEWKTIYLRETDKKLSGVINYTVGGRAKTATFEMEDEGDFTRNHIWIVYAYFVGGKLVLRPSVLPWTAGNDRLTYTTAGHTDVSYLSYLRYTPSMDSNDWTNTWIATAYGWLDDGVTPRYSTKFTISTLYPNPLRLQIDNDFFRFVIQDDDHPQPTVWDSQTYELSAGSHMFSVWIVPKDATNPGDEASIVSMSLVSVPSGMVPFFVPFSSEFPGDDAHNFIRLRRVSAADYEDNKDNLFSQYGGISPFWQYPED